METIILIRHGEGEHMVSGLTGGWSQVALTENGRDQARAVASRLSRDLKGVDYAFYCSDLKRAHQTAEIIAEEVGREMIPSQELREFNNGVAANRKKAEVKHLYRSPSDPIMDWQPYPEAETWRKFYHRIKAFMDKINSIEDRPTLIVSHGGTIVNIIAWWLRIEETNLSFTTFHSSAASLSVLDETQFNERRVERLNDTAHLHSLGQVPRLPIEINI
ncbi:MAG: histidine phosphatase family protein [Candidatus Bathyarchaeota archaeon]|jgi:probable phosphoglycerate mutase|nr:histidine phosphatase family protein [Candidatus Bathyarchaeota archaeon]